MALFNRKVENKFSVNFAKMDSNGNIFSKEDFCKVMLLERERAERSSLQFSLIVLDLDLMCENSDIKPKVFNKISENIRKIDHIGWCDDNRIGILLPFTSVEGANKLIAKICRQIESPLFETMCSVYTYPDKSDFEQKVVFKSVYGGS